MEALNQWKTAQLRLKEAASSFLDASITLRKIAAQSFPSHPNQIVLENVLDDLQSHIDSIGVVEHCMHESRAVLNALLNVSTSRVPINKLPPEILGRIFSILVASSPCHPDRNQRDALLDIIVVCGRWYQVAMNHRALWSHIDLRIASPLTINRTRLWLERSRGVPVHVHLRRDYSREQHTTLPDLISLLQPHAAFASSLTISGGDTDLARALLALHLGDNETCPLKTLSVSDAHERSREPAIPWPAYPLRGLTVLELCNLQRLACPTLDELATILSDCPELHTLRLANLGNFRVRPDQPQPHSVISLPHLKLLELSVRGEALPVLLSMLHPGDLELDVRLNIPDIGGGVVPSRTQSLLTRSNVVALTTSDTNSANGTQIQSFFSCTPRLRALYIPYFDVGILSELAGNDAMVPLLQSLWLSGKEVSLTAMNRVQQLVAARRLRYLVFSSCKFQASYDELPTNAENQNEVTDENGGAGDDEGEGEDEDNDTDEEVDFMAWEPNEVFKEMPESTKKWLSERVENLVICETPTTSIYDGVDPFVQELVKLD